MTESRTPMANPPRTHTTKVVNYGNPYVPMPDDWEPGTRVAVVDLTDLPPGLTPNLGGDGTYWGPIHAVPAGWQARSRDDMDWSTTGTFITGEVVQARPAPQPPTETVTLAAAVAGNRKIVRIADDASKYHLMVEVLVDGDDNQETSEPCDCDEFPWHGCPVHGVLADHAGIAGREQNPDTIPGGP
jgi:hypothetical protein